MTDCSSKKNKVSLRNGHKINPLVLSPPTHWRYWVSDFVCCESMKLSWPKNLVKKWFNIKGKAEDFHADDVFFRGILISLFSIST